MPDTDPLFSQLSKEDLLPQVIKSARNTRQDNKEPEEIETSDEKSRIIMQIQEKPIKKKNQENIAERTEKEGEVNLFTKLPSYFLQIQEESGFTQQKHLSETSSDDYPRNVKLTTKEKVLRKFSTKQQLNNLRDHELAFSSIVSTFICNSNWKQQNAFIWDHHLCIGERKISLNEINKIKCLLENAGHKRQKIKICRNNSTPFYFGASALRNQQAQKYPEHFLWFSKLVFNRLYLMKHYFKQSHSYTSCHNQKYSQDGHNIVCKGRIYKRGQHLGKWETRYIVITQNQLLSYKQHKKEPSFVIKSENVKYIWTRFQLYNSHLIVKIKHGVHKTELAIPLENYLERVPENWLFALYSLMVKDKNNYNI